MPEQIPLQGAQPACACRRYLSRHGLARETHSQGSQEVPRVAILPRKLGAQRSLYNPGAWLAAARARGWQVGKPAQQ